MTISSIAPPIPLARYDAERETLAPATEAPAQSRALVPMGSAERAGAARIPRPDASFVAHLIVTAEQSPQTRVLRRAASQDASALYGSVLRGAADTPNNRRVLRTA